MEEFYPKEFQRKDLYVCKLFTLGNELIKIKNLACGVEFNINHNTEESIGQLTLHIYYDPSIINLADLFFMIDATFLLQLYILDPAGNDICNYWFGIQLKNINFDFNWFSTDSTIITMKANILSIEV